MRYSDQRDTTPSLSRKQENGETKADQAEEDSWPRATLLSALLIKIPLTSHPGHVTN